MDTLIPAFVTVGGHYGDWGGGGWWIGRLVMFLLFIGLAAVAIWFFARRRPEAPVRDGTQRAADILAERFARGEVSNEEYVERLRQLREAGQGESQGGNNRG
jgi:putative membrane protein